MNHLTLLIASGDTQEIDLGFLEQLKPFWEALKAQSEKAERDGFSIDRFGGMVTYVCSMYGVATFFIAILLNRTSIIASTHRQGRSSRRRRRISVLLDSFLLQSIVLSSMRLLSLGLMLVQVKNILTTLWVVQKTSSPETISRLTKWVPTRFFEYIPEQHVSSKFMSMPRDEVRFGPTSAMLWPFFCSICFSLFTETFCSAISGSKPRITGAATLFEISVACQEMSSGFLPLGVKKVAKRPSEYILLTCLLVLGENIWNQVIGIFNRPNYRLIGLTIANALFIWFFVSTPSAIFSFPSPFILSFAIIVVVLTVIMIALAIFLLAVLAKAQNIEDLNYASYIWSADDDSGFFEKHLNVSSSQDFFTALMNIGLFAVSLAGKSSYITEYNGIIHGNSTWLEDGLWAKVKAQFKVDNLSSSSNLVQDGKVLAFLKANNMTGYANILNSPFPGLIKDSELAVDKSKRLSTIKMRCIYTKAILERFVLLVYSLTIRYAIYKFTPQWLKKKLGHSQDEISLLQENELSLQKNKAPAFVRPLMESKSTTDKNETFNLEGIADETLAEQYAAILKEKELEETDTSPDFILNYEGELESDLESDIELIDIAQGRVLRATNVSDALGELMTPDSMQEFLQEENLAILRLHLEYESGGRGVMTRSQYKKTYTSKIQQDESTKLLDLLLSKRKPPTEDDKNGEEDDEDIDPRFACVICQVSPREIITWPCKCFSICESCRLSLVSKGMEGCVTCRRDVEGVSRVYIP